MTELRFTIPGPPVPAARARVVQKETKGGKRTRAFTPEKTAAYERHVATVAALYARAARWPFAASLEHAFAVLIDVWRARDAGDADNFGKAILDGITKSGAVWLDDRLVDDLHVRKHLARPGQPPRAEVVLSEMPRETKPKTKRKTP